MSTTLNPPPPAPASPPPPPKYAADGTVAKPWYKREFHVGRAVKPEEFMNFSRQLSSFLRAGVPILDSLGVVAEENASKKMQEVIADMQRRLRAGYELRRRDLGAHRRCFPATTSRSAGPPSSPATSTTRSTSSRSTSSATPRRAASSRAR